MNIYIFFRNGAVWYPLELKDDQEAKFNAELNPGTVRVETISGKVVWQDNNRLN